jgi:23S rRNA pseudouridine2605 synthase
MERDRVTVDGNPVEARQHIYLMMNKPRGLVTTASDEKGRDTVYSLLESLGQELPWLAPVGRLDKASEGLLLFTNDSEWGSRAAAPETHLEKTYHVQVDAVAHEELIRQLQHGVNDGEALRARSVRLLRSGEKNCWLEIVLDEGRNRQIRRMMSAFGIEVLRLVRVAIGPLQLGALAKGSVRSLTSGEKLALDRAIEYKPAHHRGHRVAQRKSLLP